MGIGCRVERTLFSPRPSENILRMWRSIEENVAVHTLVTDVLTHRRRFGATKKEK